MAALSYNNARIALTSLSTAIPRRGYATTQGAVSDVAWRGGVVMKRRAEDVMRSAAEKHEKTAWGPDPKTGYYRPENLREEIDVAELRATLLMHRD